MFLNSGRILASPGELSNVLMPGTPKLDLLYSGHSQQKENNCTGLTVEVLAELLSVDTDLICWGKVPGWVGITGV